MPTETTQAVQWALTQTVDDGTGKQTPITKNDAQTLVDEVRLYFNNNHVTYTQFCFNDLQPYL